MNLNFLKILEKNKLNKKYLKIKNKKKKISEKITFYSHFQMA
jgi:hypothetical protein